MSQTCRRYETAFLCLQKSHKDGSRLRARPLFALRWIPEGVCCSWAPPRSRCGLSCLSKTEPFHRAAKPKTPSHRANATPYSRRRLEEFRGRHSGHWHRNDMRLVRVVERAAFPIRSYAINDAFVACTDEQAALLVKHQ